MDTPHARLRAARIAAGYESSATAAARLSINYNTYVAHENGSRGFGAKAANTYATNFNTTLQWLMLGKVDGPLGEEAAHKMQNQMNIGAKLRRERQRRGWSQAHVANQLNVTRAAVSQWEKDQTKPRYSVLQELSSLFGVALDNLLATTPTNNTSTQQGIDPLLVETWRHLTPKQRRRLAQIALIIAEE